MLVGLFSVGPPTKFPFCNIACLREFIADLIAVG